MNARENASVDAERRLSLRFCRLLTGLDAGAWASLGVLVWLGTQSAIRNEPWWTPYNLAAAPFYGERVFHAGLGKATAAGAAHLFLIYTLAGALFGLVASVTGFGRNVFLGIIWGGALQIAQERFGWQRLHPFAPAYFPPVAVLPGHLLYGLTLGLLYARRFRTLALAAGDLSWASAFLPKPAEPAVEPVGETQGQSEVRDDSEPRASGGDDPSQPTDSQ